MNTRVIDIIPFKHMQGSPAINQGMAFRDFNKCFKKAQACVQWFMDVSIEGSGLILKSHPKIVLISPEVSQTIED